MGEELEKEKRKIRSVVIANGKRGVRLRYFAKEFQELQDEELQYKAFGFSSVPEMLLACPDSARIGPDPEYLGESRVFMVADADTAHILNMQRNTRTKPMKKSGHGCTSRAYKGYEQPGHLQPLHNYWPHLSGHWPLRHRSPLLTPLSTQRPLIQQSGLLRSPQHSPQLSKQKQHSSSRIPEVINKNTSKTTANVPLIYRKLSGKEKENIKKILATCPYGALNCVVEKEYKSSHSKDLPGNWVQQMSGMINVDKVYGEGMMKVSVVKKLSGAEDTLVPPVNLQQTSKGGFLMKWQEQTNSASSPSISKDLDRSSESDEEEWSQPVTISLTKATDCSSERAAPCGRIYTIPTSNSTPPKSSAPTAPPPLCAPGRVRAPASALMAYAHQYNVLPQLVTAPPPLLNAPPPASVAPPPQFTAPPIDSSTPFSRSSPQMVIGPAHQKVDKEMVSLGQSTPAQTLPMKRREDKRQQTTCPPASLRWTLPPLLWREDSLQKTTCPTASLGRTKPPLLHLGNKGHNQQSYNQTVDLQPLFDLLDAISMGEVLAQGLAAPRDNCKDYSRFDDSDCDSGSQYSADGEEEDSDIDIDNRQRDCICGRGQGLVLCYDCFSCQPNARVRRRCQVHPGMYLQQDYHCCPDCHSEKISVLAKSTIDGC